MSTTDTHTAHGAYMTTLNLLDREIPEGRYDVPDDAPAAITPIEPEPLTMRGQLHPGTRRAYVLAGQSTVTVRSPKTGQRFTYRVKQSDPDPVNPGRMPVWFVGLLSGPDNGADYTYLGTIFADGFRTTRKSRIAPDAPSVVAFQWFSRHWEDARVEVWHEGRCGRCGRTLTVPESIATGIGPVCAGKAA